MRSRIDPLDLVEMIKEAGQNLISGRSGTALHIEEPPLGITDCV